MRLGALTSKAGMSFSFMGLMVAGARSIKDSRLWRVEGRRRVGLALADKLQYEASVLGDGKGDEEGAIQ